MNKKDEITAWPLTARNSWIRDPVTLHDFVPLGVEFEETEDHRLIYPDRYWRRSCFLLWVLGETSDGFKFIFQGGLPFLGKSKDTYFLENRWYSLFSFAGDMYYDNKGEIYAFPTVYKEGVGKDGEKYIGSISFDEEKREWIYEVAPSGDGKFHTIIKCHARGIPFWMGKSEGPYIIHGAISDKKNIDIWGGFWEMGMCTGEIAMPDVGNIKFDGGFVWDRAYHRVYYPDFPDAVSGQTLEFLCAGLQQEEVDILIATSNNPSPTKPPVSFQHQGRIDFASKGKSFTFNCFEFNDLGGLQPKRFSLRGTYEGGEVILKGNAFMYFPKKWDVKRAVWWDLFGKYVWGRAYCNWEGHITFEGETINVSTHGFVENTRYCPSVVSCLSPRLKYRTLIPREKYGVRMPRIDCLEKKKHRRVKI